MCDRAVYHPSKKTLHSLKLTSKAPENDAFQARNLRNSRGPPFSGAIELLVSGGVAASPAKTHQPQNTEFPILPEPSWSRHTNTKVNELSIFYSQLFLQLLDLRKTTKKTMEKTPTNLEIEKNTPHGPGPVDFTKKHRKTNKPQKKLRWGDLLHGCFSSHSSRAEVAFRIHRNKCRGLKQNCVATSMTR